MLGGHHHLVATVATKITLLYLLYFYNHHYQSIKRQSCHSFILNRASSRPEMAPLDVSTNFVAVNGQKGHKYHHVHQRVTGGQAAATITASEQNCHNQIPKWPPNLTTPQPAVTQISPRHRRMAT
jgi:hypothetical protein